MVDWFELHGPSSNFSVIFIAFNILIVRNSTRRINDSFPDRYLITQLVPFAFTQYMWTHLFRRRVCDPFKKRWEVKWNEVIQFSDLEHLARVRITRLTLRISDLKETSNFWVGISPKFRELRLKMLNQVSQVSFIQLRITKSVVRNRRLWNSLCTIRRYKQMLLELPNIQRFFDHSFPSNDSNLGTQRIQELTGPHEKIAIRRTMRPHTKTLHVQAVTPQPKICVPIYPAKWRGRYSARLLILDCGREGSCKWRGDPLVRDLLTTTEEKVKENRLRNWLRNPSRSPPVPAGRLVQPRHSE
jgi:hypothetical protein